MLPSCPARDDLARFSFGRLTEPAAEEIATHVDSCAHCQTNLEEISRQPDPLAAAVKASGELPFAGESALAEALSAVQEFSPSAFEATSAGNSPGPSATFTNLKLIRDYEILEKLGEGGMGAVYKARHQRLKKLVALKVLPRDRVVTADAIARFEREMEAVGKLEHAHLVRAMDAGEVEGTHFLVMEYIGGPDLSQLVKQRGPLAIADACELIRQAAVGLQHVHEQGLVHRDIKPSNLMLSSSGTVKILDLGLALLAGDGTTTGRELTTSGQMMGTLDYMAPEQGGDTHHVDIRADIYSLGATLYKLLTGVAPFGDAKFDTPVKKLMALATQEPTPLRERRPEVPPELAFVVSKMLGKDPATRIPTPGEVERALAPFAVGNAVSELAASVAGMPNSPPRREGETRPSLKSASVETMPPSWKPETKAASIVQGMPFSLRLLAVTAAVLLIGGFAAWAGIVFYWETPAGLVLVELGEGVSAKFDRNELIITGADREHIRVQATTESKKESRGKSVPSGEHTLTITRGNFKFQTTNFEIDAKGKTILKVELLGDAEIRVSKNGVPLRHLSVAGDEEPVVNAANGASNASTSPTDTFSESSGGRKALVYTVKPYWSATNGELLFGSDEFKHQWLFFGDKNWTDYDFQARVLRLRSGSGSGGVSLAFRSNKNFENAGLFSFGSKGASLVFNVGGKHFFSKQVDGVAVPELAGANEKLISGRWYTLKVMIRGQTVRCFLDGKDQGTFDKVPFARGRVGLHIGPATYRFREIQVTAPDGTVLWSGLPDLPLSPLPVPDKYAASQKPASEDLSPSGGDYALVFDGKSSRVEIRSLKPKTDAPLTMETFIQFDKAAGELQAIASAYDPSSALMMGRNSGSPVFLARQDLQTQMVGMAGATKDGEWLHLAGVWDGKTACLYVNGKLHDKTRTGAATQPMVAKQNQPLMFGADFGLEGLPPTNFFHGLLDEIRLSKIARYDKEFAPPKPRERFVLDEHTLALYHCDEGEGGQLLDASPHGHHGKIVGARWMALERSVAGRMAGWPADAPEAAIAPFDSVIARQRQQAWADFLDIPVRWENSLQMKFVLIPPGEFTMGATQETIDHQLKWIAQNDKPWQDCVKSGRPQHKVMITRPFYLGIHEVTQAQYERVMDANPAAFSKSGRDQSLTERVAGMDTANHPVERVSWNDAAAFCAKLSERESLEPYDAIDGKTVTNRHWIGYRLPTEAEWEFACRAGTITKYSAGDQDKDLEQAGWFSNNSAGRTHAVGGLKANPFGLFDMHGNVWELVLDWWDAEFFQQFQTARAVNPTGPAEGTRRLCRGGDWYNAAVHCRSTSRNAPAPSDRQITIGFRAAISVDAVKWSRETSPSGGTK